MIQSLERAVKILRLVAESGDGIRLCDLARACETKRNTIFNLADTLVSLRAKNPFDYHGLNVWCSMDKFMAQVEIARRKGYAETPQITPRTDFKVGIPVRARDGGMAGAVTFHLFNLNGLNEREILREVMTSVEKIGGGEVLKF